MATPPLSQSFRLKETRSDFSGLQFELGGSCNVIIRRELGV
jgi:hypothetical protein